MLKSSLCVHMHINGLFVPAGMLTYISAGKDSRWEFRYGKKYLQNPNALPVDPIQLPLENNEKTLNILTAFVMLVLIPGASIFWREQPILPKFPFRDRPHSLCWP